MQFNLDERGKIFVGGLSWDTTHGSMLKYFSHYGEVIDCVVMKNQATGRSRGFGFVTFKDPECVSVVLSLVPHILDGRQIDPKSCNPRSMNKGGKSAENSRKKIFIGGLPLSATEPELRDQFSAYGQVSEVVIMYDQQKHRSRGFGFLTFETEESVDRVIEDHFIQVNGKQVEVKRAEPRDMKTIADMSPICVGRSLAIQQQQQQQQMQRMSAIGQPSAVGPMVALANPGLMQAAAGAFPITYSALPAQYCHNSATLVAQCFQHPGVTYAFGVGDQCNSLPMISAQSLTPLYTTPWLQCQLPDLSAVTSLDLSGSAVSLASNPRPGALHSALPAPPSCNQMISSDLLGRIYTLSAAGFTSAAQFGLVDGMGECDETNKSQPSASSAPSYHQFALNDYGLGLCSVMAQNGAGDSVGFSFIDPTNGSHARISSYHSIASQGFHPYKR